MTTPKVATVRKGGSRLYVDELTGERQPGVTSIINMLAKPGLRYYYAKKTAESAIEDLGTIIEMVTKGRPDDAIDWLKPAPGRHSGKAADIGTQVHSIVEQLNRGESVTVHPDFQGFVDRYKEFLDLWQPEWLEVEATIWNDAVGYAGTCDGIARIQGEIAIVDLKTGQSGVYPEAGIQLNAYANGEFILEPNGDRRPLPKIEAAAVVHLRPDKCEVIPIRLGADIFQTFCALREVFTWETDIKNNVVGKPVAPDSESE